MKSKNVRAATFEHVMNLDEPRTDCPTQLPDLPEPDFIGVLRMMYYTSVCEKGTKVNCTFHTP